MEIRPPSGFRLCYSQKLSFDASKPSERVHGEAARTFPETVVLRKTASPSG
jgi:hypothetical protein